jgi:Uma2 family endonuclease
MGEPAEQLAEATYADLEALPSNTVGQILHGILYAMPRPASLHTLACSSLGDELVGPFQKSRGGPGGWWILDEPELHFANPRVKAGKDVLVPDLAGWRRERMPEVLDAPFFTLAPDWICEVLSPSTEEIDREKKMPIYLREGVRDAWLVDPVKRTLEWYARRDRRWLEGGRWGGDERVRVAPFEAVEIALGVLWG